MRRRILLAMVVVTAVAIALFAVPLAVVTASFHRSSAVGDLERSASDVLLVLPDTGLEGGAPFQLPDPTGEEHSAVYDASGMLVNGIGPSGADGLVRRSLGGEAGDGHIGSELVVTVPIIDENNVVGVVRVAEPWSVVTRAAQRSWTLMAVGAIVAVGLAAALAAALSRRLVAPLDDLVDVAVRLGDGDFVARVAPAGVAELDRAGVALNSTAGRLAGLVQRERSFAADVSHQLSTPLTSLRLQLEGAVLDPDQARDEVLHSSLTEVDRLQATIETLLAVARDSSITGEAADLGAVCRELGDALRPRIDRLGRQLRLDIEPDVAPVRCPPQVLREIFVVLVDNAIEHGAGTIDITVRRRGAGATVSVSDDGPGVPRERAERIFARRDSSAAGNGIGLSLARSLAEAHDLRVELTRTGQAPVFTVACPGVTTPA